MVSHIDYIHIFFDCKVIFSHLFHRGCHPPMPLHWLKYCGWLQSPPANCRQAAVSFYGGCPGETPGYLVTVFSLYGLRFLLQCGDLLSERFLFVLVFLKQVDTDFFGDFNKHLVLVNRADQLVQLGKPAP